MILVFGSRDDSCIQSVVDTAHELGVEHRFVDQLTLDHDEFAVHVGPHGTTGKIRISGEVHDLADFAAVYARPLQVGPGQRAQALTDAFVQWLDFADATVVNRPLSMRSNASKPYQAQLIARAGFAVPDTLVTNDPELVLAFRRRHGRVVFKSTSGVRSIVRELTDAYVATLPRVRALPTQFQVYVDGTDVRVHVVGGAVFATEMTTTAVDYRYATRDGAEVTHRPTDVPADVERRCLALSETLDLPLCGIDLRRRPSGEYVCFEVNPMPAFSYYEENAGQPIARALVEFLGKA